MSTKYKQETPNTTPALASALSIAYLVSAKRAGFKATHFLTLGYTACDGKKFFKLAR